MKKKVNKKGFYVCVYNNRNLRNPVIKFETRDLALKHHLKNGDRPLIAIIHTYEESK